MKYRKKEMTERNIAKVPENLRGTGGVVWSCLLAF